MRAGGHGFRGKAGRLACYGCDMPRAALLARIAVVLLASFASLGCDAEAPDLREWKPTDHDHTEAPGRDQVDVADGGAQNPLAAHGISDVVLVAWKQKCVTCHGTIGRGDGPQARMYAPPDLSDTKRQGEISDEDIAQVIKNGRGKMPAFDLPDSTIEGLVKLVRLIGGAADAPAGADSAAPAGSGAPPASATPHAATAPSTAPAQPQPTPAAARPAGAGGSSARPTPAAP